MLYQKDADSGKLLEDLVVDLCKEKPRGKVEIRMLVKKATGMRIGRDGIYKRLLASLIESGRLKLTIPDYPQSQNQKYICGDVPSPSTKEILEFCQEPKSKKELMRHFNLPNEFYFLRTVGKLVKDKKLWTTQPNSTAIRGTQRR